MPLPIAAVVDGMLYYPNGPSSALTTNSSRYVVPSAAACSGPGFTFTPPDVCCADASTMGDFVPTSAVPLAATPPFHVEGP